MSVVYFLSMCPSVILFWGSTGIPKNEHCPSAPGILSNGWWNMTLNRCAPRVGIHSLKCSKDASRANFSYYWNWSHLNLWGTSYPVSLNLKAPNDLSIPPNPWYLFRIEQPSLKELWVDFRASLGLRSSSSSLPCNSGMAEKRPSACGQLNSMVKPEGDLWWSRLAVWHSSQCDHPPNISELVSQFHSILAPGPPRS